MSRKRTRMTDNIDRATRSGIISKSHDDCVLTANTIGYRGYRSQKKEEKEKEGEERKKKKEIRWHRNTGHFFLIQTNDTLGLT